jgi:membrane-anchored protein YejM (alkaline phosphatase superfamily)
MGIVLGIVALESILAYFLWKKVACFERLKMGKKVFWGWLMCFLFCYVALLVTMSRRNNLLLQQTVNLPLYTPILSHIVPGKNAADMIGHYCEHHYTQAIFAKDRLYYPKQVMNCQQPSKKYHIIMLMADSLRFDSVSVKYMPITHHFVEKNWQFLKHYSGGNST